MKYRLFLDNDRTPAIVGNYILPVELRIQYRLQAWVTVRNYLQFEDFISKHGLPTHVSFDHDLAPKMFNKHFVNGIFNYHAKDFLNPNNRTGYHCADWLCKYCHKRKLPLPICYIHSLNVYGKQNIEELIRLYKPKIP